MDVSRRDFLGCCGGAVMMTLPRWRRVERHFRCVVLDLEEHCSLRESVSGYQAALAKLDVCHCDALIVPAALTIPPAASRLIVHALQRGATVILESGAGFVAADGPELRAHRDALRDALRLRIESPVDVWTADTRRRRVPYVDFTWPSAAKVRDFSRAVPLGQQEGKIIARVNGLPVAITRRMGRGTLVFLGSPVGPALWIGDMESRRWLRDVLNR
jgi:hypothetical protein